MASYLKILESTTPLSGPPILQLLLNFFTEHASLRIARISHIQPKE